MSSYPEHSGPADGPNAGELLRRMMEVGSNPEVMALDVRRSFPEFSSETAWKLYGRVVDRISIQQLTTADLVAVVRAMTLCEAQFHVPGGSVSMVIHAFAELGRRDRTLADELAGWLVDHRGDNWYIPWGTMIASDARSLAEYEAVRRGIAERHEAEQYELQGAAAQRRAERRRRQVEHTLRAARARPIRESRITAALFLSDDECVHLVVDAPETVDYWPEEVSTKCAIALPGLSDRTLTALARRVLRRPRTAHWKALRSSARAELRARSLEAR